MVQKSTLCWIIVIVEELAIWNLGFIKKFVICKEVIFVLKNLKFFSCSILFKFWNFDELFIKSMADDFSLKEAISVGIPGQCGGVEPVLHSEKTYLMK